MTNPSSDVPDDRIGTSLEHFRQALTRSVARKNMGIHLGDEHAGLIAADDDLSAIWYRAWRSRMPHPALHGATGPAPEDTVDEVAWDRELPLRFNPPPGWTMPSHTWIVRHIGLEMSDEWRPDGAPTTAPADWLWWVPQEPAWTRWMERETRTFRLLPWMLGGFAASVLVISALPYTGWTVVAYIVGIASAVGAILVSARHRRFRMDPVGRVRNDYPDSWESPVTVNPSGGLRGFVAGDWDEGGSDFDLDF